MIQAHQSQLAEVNNVFVRDSDHRHKDHQAQLTSLEKHHTRAMATAAADSADALAKVQYLQNAGKKLLGQGDRYSRDQVIATCTELGNEAIILSGVMFHAPKSATYSQIDHIVLTAGRVLLIENKYWDAVVFDGEVSPDAPLARFLTDSEITNTQSGECALRISRKGAWIKVHVHANSGDRERTPTGQVKRQAALLRSYLKTRGIECNWIDTCVYYSHPNGQIYLRSHDRTMTLIGDKQQLRQWIRSRCASARPPASDELIQALEEISFDRANVVPDLAHFLRFRRR